MNVSEQIAAWLNKKNVDHAFMVTGGGAMFLNQAFGTNKYYKRLKRFNINLKNNNVENMFMMK